MFPLNLRLFNQRANLRALNHICILAVMRKAYRAGERRYKMAAGTVETNITNIHAFKGASFDGVDDYVTLAHNVNQIIPSVANGLTISAWVNPKSIGESAGGRILVKTDAGTGSSNGFQYHMGLQLVNFQLNGGSNIASTTGTVPYGKWTHVLLTLSSAQIATHYINGLSENIGDCVQTISNITTTQDVKIGNRNGGTDRSYDGSISKVKMWNKVLSSEEIAQDYAGGVVEDGLIIDVPLQDDYTDNKGNTTTNSGSRLAIVDDSVAAAIKADRTTANDKYLITSIQGQIISNIIEEAP